MVTHMDNLQNIRVYCASLNLSSLFQHAAQDHGTELISHISLCVDELSRPSCPPPSFKSLMSFFVVSTLNYISRVGIYRILGYCFVWL
jgi:hypothetical protein